MNGPYERTAQTASDGGSWPVMALSQQTIEDLDSAARTGVYAGYEPLDEIRAGLPELIEYDPATEAEVAADRDAAVRVVDEIVNRHADQRRHC